MTATNPRLAVFGLAGGAGLEALAVRVLATGRISTEFAIALAVAIPVGTAFVAGLFPGLVAGATGVALAPVLVSSHALRAALALTAGLIAAALTGYAADQMRRSSTRARLLQRMLDVVSGAVSDAVIGIDPSGTIAGWSTRAARLYGYAADEAVGRPFSLLFREDSAAVERLLEQVRHGARVARSDLVHGHADGRELTARLTLVPVLGESVGVIGAYAVVTDLADQLRLKEAVNESEARFRTLVAQIPVATYRRSLEPPHEWLDVSPRIDPLLGFSVDEWIGNRELYSRLIHPADRERVLGRDDGGEPRRDEYRMYARDGRVVWVRDESAVVRDGEGRPLYLQGYLLDISGEKTLEAERERVRAAEHAAATRANDKQQRIDLLAEVSQVLASPPDYERAIQKVADLVTRQLADWCIVSLFDAKGELAPAGIAHAEPTSPRVVRDEERDLIDERVAYRVAESGVAEVRESYVCVPLAVRGRVLGVLTLLAAKPGPTYSSADVTLVMDIALRIAAAVDNAQLHREVEERADAARVLTYVADGVFLVDRSGVIRLWNPAAEAITGLEASTIVGRVAGDALPDWDRLAERIPISEAPEPAYAKTIPLETAKGERWISISGVDFFGGTVYAFRDFTEERRLEELKADFVATASHELRTPLAAVYGAAQTLRRHDFALDEAGRDRFVSLIAEESERLSRIVNEILLANQLDAGRLDVVGEAFDPVELVERVAESARAHLPPGLTLEIVAPGAHSTVAADRDKVRQVLVNLVENAIKYSPDGGTVQLGLEAGDTTVRFWVKDNGLGIPPEEQARIFDKFYRVDPEMTRGVGGTGLGLYICSELVSRMGGSIAVESNLGEGSVFSFELPSGEAAASRLPGADPATAASA